MCSRSSIPVRFTTKQLTLRTTYLATEKKSFLLRIDPQLWAALEKLAASELRSVNGQIEYLLRDAVGKRGLLDVRASGAADAADEKSVGQEDAGGDAE